MSLIAVINIFLDSEFLEHQHTTYTKKIFLFQSVFPIATVKNLCYVTVIYGVFVVVCIHEIQTDSSYVNAPYISINSIVGERNFHNHLFSCLRIYNFVYGKSIKVLSLIVCNLLTIHAKSLAEIAITIQKTNSTKIYIGVRCLLQIVSCKNTQTARVNL